MSTTTSSSNKLDARSADRCLGQVFIKVKALGEQDDQYVIASTTDISDSGLGLVAFKSYPVGTRVAINMNGQLVAIGEIARLSDEWNMCGWIGAERLGVRLIEKNSSWPLC